VKTVSRLSIAPVKAMALVHPREIRLEHFGVAANRRFHIVDEDGRRYDQLRYGALALVVPDYDVDAGRLALRFPDGAIVTGELDGDLDGAEPIVTEFAGRRVASRVLRGPWSEAISAFAGRPLRLAMTDEPGAGVDRIRGTVTMLSDASLDALARQTGGETVDARRFRMLIGIAGCAPHEEDEWLGGLVRVGDAVVRLHEQVARCATTTQNPDTGVPDLDTLRAIKAYRGFRDEESRHVDFGVFGEVEQPGMVRLGDRVEPLDD
jgi:MOSC domain-containing protein